MILIKVKFKPNIFFTKVLVYGFSYNTLEKKLEQIAYGFLYKLFKPICFMNSFFSITVEKCKREKQFC